MKNLFWVVFLLFNCFSCNLEKFPDITSVPAPTACFISDKMSCVANDCTISFDASCSTNAISYEWSFGDGGLDSGVNVNHRFTQEGSYTVTLVVKNQNQQSDTVTKVITVNKGEELLEASFTLNPTKCTVPCEVTITNISTGTITQHEWDFGDGTFGSQSAQSFIKTYTEAGNYTINYTASDGTSSSQATPRSVMVEAQNYTLIPLDWENNMEVSKDASLVIRVRLRDQDNNFIAGVRIDFDDSSPDGSADDVFTDGNGIAETVWKYSNSFGEKELSAKVDESETIRSNTLEFEIMANKFTDPIEGREYKAVLMKGKKWWMAENLDMNVPGSWCYNNSTSKCMQYGRLYTWEAAQSACNLLGGDWQLPKDEYWEELAIDCGGLRDCGTGCIDIGSPEASYIALIQGGISGFSAQLGGFRQDSGSYEDENSISFYWSMTEKDSINAWGYSFNDEVDNLFRYFYKKSRGYSVRCLLDP